tara:strand:+ start:561 stop:839 length:279 start_codon:yes stop_codon:yes gene_type:complete
VRTKTHNIPELKNIPEINQSIIQRGTAQSQNKAEIKNEGRLNEIFFFIFGWSKGFSKEQPGQNVASSISILWQLVHSGIFNPNGYKFCKFLL